MYAVTVLPTVPLTYRCVGHWFTVDAATPAEAVRLCQERDAAECRRLAAQVDRYLAQRGAEVMSENDQK